jgi:hypothetical protein
MGAAQLVLLLAFKIATQQVEAQIRNSEVWLIRAGESRQLTHDGKSKVQAVLSPFQDRIAYYEECPVAEHCVPAVVILDLNGLQVGRFRPKSQRHHGPCMAILSLAWFGEYDIAAECHVSPSSSEYIVTDLTSGQTKRDLLGLWFAPTPNGRAVAHAGWIPHFSLPPAQSNYLQIDSTIVYPLASGMKPFELKDAEPPPSVVRQSGLTFSGIHEFDPHLVWAPDSQTVGLIDCTYTWTANSAEFTSAADGQESNRQCSAVAVSRTGGVTSLPLAQFPADMRLMWVDSRHLSVEARGLNESLEVK